MSDGNKIQPDPSVDLWYHCLDYGARNVAVQLPVGVEFFTYNVVLNKTKAGWCENSHFMKIFNKHLMQRCEEEGLTLITKPVDNRMCTIKLVNNNSGKKLPDMWGNYE